MKKKGNENEDPVVRTIAENTLPDIEFDDFQTLNLTLEKSSSSESSFVKDDCKVSFEVRANDQFAIDLVELMSLSFKQIVCLDS